jgi:MFS superfamily sulfate permease-like transporter
MTKKIDDFDWAAKQNLKAMEDEEMMVEYLSDKLEDYGVYHLNLNESCSFGDYENTFTCIDFKEEHTDNGEKLTTRLIKADFYNDDYGIEPVYLISQISNGEYNMEEHNSEDTWEEIEAIYWFDQFDSDNPAFDNKHIRTIVENCDIFLDEM